MQLQPALHETEAKMSTGSRNFVARGKACDVAFSSVSTALGSKHCCGGDDLDSVRAPKTKRIKESLDTMSSNF